MKEKKERRREKMRREGKNLEVKLLVNKRVKDMVELYEKKER